MILDEEVRMAHSLCWRYKLSPSELASRIGIQTTMEICADKKIK